jgi:prolyl-tRNA synthetase
VETIASLAEFLGIGPERTAKAAFFMAGQELIFAVVRGDMEVNETKLANAVGVLELRPAGPEDLSAAGIVAGYASPIGVSGVRVVADDLLTRSPNLVAGANRPGFHLRNTNLGRDYTAEVVADIAAATEGAPCAHCGHPLRLVRGVEVANTFKLGTTYSRPLDATFLDQDGHSRHVVMGSYGIGVGRLIGCIAERWRDERGLMWPAAVAPFHVYLVGLDRDNAEVRETADAVYRRLQKAGVEVLYDDREERAGVKFNDADLVGLPLRLTISRRTVQQDGVEMRRRSDGVIWTVPMEQVEVEIWRELNTGGAHDVAHTATGALPTA